MHARFCARPHRDNCLRQDGSCYWPNLPAMGNLSPETAAASWPEASTESACQHASMPACQPPSPSGVYPPLAVLLCSFKVFAWSLRQNRRIGVDIHCSAVWFQAGIPFRYTVLREECEEWRGRHSILDYRGVVDSLRRANVMYCTTKA